MADDYELRRHGETLISRFNALYNAGYRVAPHWAMDIQFALVHPSKKAPKLGLNDDGGLTLLFPTSDMPAHQLIDIPADDDRGFKRFVAGVPRPNYLQTLGQTTVGRLGETILALAFVAFVWFLLTKGLEALFPGLKDLW